MNLDRRQAHLKFSNSLCSLGQASRWPFPPHSVVDPARPAPPTAQCRYRITMSLFYCPVLLLLELKWLSSKDAAPTGKGGRKPSPLKMLIICDSIVRDLNLKSALSFSFQVLRSQIWWTKSLPAFTTTQC